MNDYTPLHSYKVGDKIKFAGEKQRYTVRAAGDRYLVCTKPFNLRATVIYTVVDFVEKVRGTENKVFCLGAESDENCNDMLWRLEFTHPELGETSDVSKRNRVPLEIER